LDIGVVLSDTFAVIGRTFVVLANLAVMFVAIPAAINIAGVALTPVSPIFAILSLIGSIASGVGVLLAYSAIFLLAMQDLHGQTASTEIMIKTALSKFWPMLGVAILLGLGVFVGALLLIVPGVILALAWSVAMPALVLEDRGVFESFGRSAALTRGKRGSIFLMSFLVGVIMGIIELVLFAVFGGFHGLVTREPSTVTTVLSSLLSVVTVPFGAVLSTALFNQLRGNAGYGAEAVAEVFA
jgi:hypothetical protein